jgi:hypothetical protein
LPRLFFIIERSGRRVHFRRGYELAGVTAHYFLFHRRRKNRAQIQLDFVHRRARQSRLLRYVRKNFIKRHFKGGGYFFGVLAAASVPTQNIIQRRFINTGPLAETYTLYAVKHALVFQSVVVFQIAAFTQFLKQAIEHLRGYIFQLDSANARYDVVI